MSSLKLNPQQQVAMLDDSRAVLVIAGAGTGKTRVLTARIAHLVESRQIPSRSILAVTFSNKAAREMRERVSSLLGDFDFPPLIGTFHSTCARLLREFAESSDLDKNFVIYDAQDQKQSIKRLLKSMNIDEKQYPIPSLTWEMEHYKNQGLDPVEEASDPLRARIFGEYRKILSASNAVDFSDLLYKTFHLLNNNNDVLRTLQERWRFILVDEFQDTNKIQRDLVYLIVGSCNEIFVVGDEDQSIYGWRGADIGNILRFDCDFEQAAIHKLEQNYRSTQNILNVANAVIEHNQGRRGKNLWTDRGTGSEVMYHACNSERDEAEKVLQLAETSRYSDQKRYRDMVILYRTNSQSRSFEEAAIRAGIPYQIVGGLKFYERKEIKDVLAFMRFLSNPLDAVSFRRIIGTLPCGVGEKSIDKLVQAAQSARRSVLQAMESCDQLFGRAMANKIRKVGGTLVRCKGLLDHGDFPVPQLVEKIMIDSGYLGLLRAEKTEEAQNRIDNIYEFLASLEEMTKQNSELQLDEILQQISLLTDIDSMDADTDTLTFMTLHASKGLEYEVVFLTGLEEGVFPHKRSMESPDELEEERRLCYVGMTRAQDILHLTGCLSRRVFNNIEYNMPSRFLKEIPADMLVVGGAESFHQGVRRYFDSATEAC